MLRNLLNGWMVEQNVSGTLGSSVTVTASPPDAVKLEGANAQTQLNLFLHQVTPNLGWRNVGLPSRDGGGARLSNPPLALDLHYLVTAYGVKDLHAEVVLGHAMHFLHENPVLDRQAIRDVLAAGAAEVPGLSSATDLADQMEQIKITPTSMSTEEMSRLWSALQAHYRPTASYHVSVVLVEARQPARSALPVLTRGPVDPMTSRERGVTADATMLPPLPAIEAVHLPGGQPAARLGDRVDVTGHHLDGTNRAAVLSNARFAVEQEIPALAGGGFGLLQFTVPNAPTDFPVAVYLLSVRVLRPGETTARSTNRLPVLIAPEITTALPMNVTRDAQGTATITLACRPDVRPGQRTTLVLGEREVFADPFAASTATLTFRFAAALPGTYLARLRVDGIESLVIDRSATPPAFLNHRITVT